MSLRLKKLEQQIFNYCFFFRGFTLHEALTMIEDDEVDAEELTLLPPNNACDEVTDEDSGDEDIMDINNLPSSFMRSMVEVACKRKSDEDWDSDDEIPISEIKKRLSFSAKKKKVYEYVKEDLPSNTHLFEKEEFYYVEEDPSTLFFNFFDDDILKLMVSETNRYASQKNKTQTVTLSEIKCFLGILILSGYIPLARRRMFWEKNSDCHNDLVAESISRDKFEYIMSNLHLVDNTAISKTDKFAKVRPLFDHLNKKFLEFSTAEEHHSIDEAMVPYNGRHGCKQYIHGKPIRYGFKLWVGTTRLGFINWFEPYQGASTSISKTYKDLGVGSSVVLEYADRLKEKWPNLIFHLFFDNFFSSPVLLECLSEKKLFGTGTIRENRIPKSLLEESKIMKRRHRGIFDYWKIKDANIIFIKWHDNNIVTFCSNSCGVNPVHSVKRYSQKDKKFIQVEQPHVVNLYNKNMGGVDRSDQNISLYRVGIRGKKWYFPLISHCIDMAIQNSWHIHKKSGGTLDQLAFRRALAKTILMQNKKPYTYQIGRPIQNTLRYDRLDHYVIPQDRQTRCGECHQKTTTRCQKCNVGLHVKCFVKYHLM